MIGQGVSGSDIAEEDDLWFWQAPWKRMISPLEYLLHQRPRRGEITPQELQGENLIFRGFRKDVIGLKPKGVGFVFVEPGT